MEDKKFLIPSLKQTTLTMEPDGMRLYRGDPESCDEEEVLIPWVLWPRLRQEMDRMARIAAHRIEFGGA